MSHSFGYDNAVLAISDFESPPFASTPLEAEPARAVGAKTSSRGLETPLLEIPQYPNVNRTMSAAEEHVDYNTLYRDWEAFIRTGIIHDRVNPVVAKSWEKCRRHGVDPEAGMGRSADSALFESILQENEMLVEIARPVMRSVMDLVHKSHFWMVLTDCAGYLLEAIGDSSIARRAHDLRFEKGALWCDLEVGSNAIGIALDYNTPIQMRGPEHYCRSHHGWTCSAAPIRGLRGEVVGCINISGASEDSHPHTLGLAMTAALVIETQILSRHHAKLMQLSLDGNADCMLVLDRNFRPAFANRAARELLEMPAGEIAMIGDFRLLLPDVDWNDVQRNPKGEIYVSDDTRLMSGDKILPCSVTISPIEAGFNRSYSVTLKRQEHIIRSVNLMAGNRSWYTFDDILTKSAAMTKTITLAKKYSRYSGVVLIQGESGTGKEMFAQAIHSASGRADKPFVAINCATLPRDLIESELFGYEKGAFTGANNEGNPGKFELANQGTIFLDEIGELPLEFQAKLLRVVETKKVRRLGGCAEKALDVRIIAATNRNLRLEAMEGRFREDLFFRLHVMCLLIPPLRERMEDVPYCAEVFLEHFNRRFPDQRKAMSDAFRAGLVKHKWPGNVRELQNCMERAFYSCSGEILGPKELDAVFDARKSMPQEPLTRRDLQHRQEILDALLDCQGDVKLMAEKTGSSLATVYRHIKKYGIDPKCFRK